MNQERPTGLRILNAAELGEGARTAMSDILVEGFYQWLSYFSKDKARLKRAFGHMFRLDAFYVALAGDEIAGMAALTNGKTPSVKLSFKELRRHLGFARGMLAGVILRKEFERHAYPFAMGANEASVEFVATAPKCRGQGVALAIIRHFFTLSQYDSYVLEVADTNKNAVNLYEKLGFREFTRVKTKDPKRSGIDYFVYMRFRCPAPTEATAPLNN